MHFGLINNLHWFWALIPIGYLFFYGFKIKQEKIRRFVDGPIKDQIVFGNNTSRQILKIICLILVYILGILALARPQWGFEWKEVKRKGLDIIVAVDTSKSMLTQDVRPNRLERTKLGVLDLIKKLKGDRIGLMAFAGDAFLMCPLTVDYNGFILSLNDLSVDSVPRGGTDIGKAIEEAIHDFEQAKSETKILIVATDGDNLDGEPLLWAKKAKDKGIKIFTVGIGTSEGELIQINNDSGEKEFLKDKDGNYVKSRLNQNLLEQIALESEGGYVRSSGAQFGLDTIYEQKLSKFQKNEFESKMEKKFFERFQIPLTLALFLLVFETCINIQRPKQ